MHAYDGRDWARWSGDADSAQYLRDLVEHRHVVETLEALSHGPTTAAHLTRQVRVGRRGLAAALRILASRGLVSTDGTGSWDAPAPRGTLYHLTDRGRVVVATLSRLSVWTMLVEGSDLDGRSDRST